MEELPRGRMESASMPAEVALAVAVELHRGGNLANAETIYRGILGAVPDQPDALHYLGVLSHQMGRRDEAVELLHRALALAPRHADMHNNLGNVLKEQGRLDEAAEAYQRVVELQPEHADAHNNLGVTLKARGRYEAAARSYCRAIEIQPDHADAHLNLANALRRLGKADEALAACRKAVELKPENSDANENLANALHRAGRIEEALAVLRRWATFVPGHPIALHMIAAISGDETPERAPDPYVKELFDRFASTFDEALHSLGYQAPQLAMEAVARAIPEPSGVLDVLDAGCGTGLCGPLLGPYARSLTGVDLSGKMLSRANGRGVYTELVEAELTGYLEGRSEAFDLLVAADTLVYFGGLDRVLGAVAGALRPGGHLVFTVEAAPCPVPAEGFLLNPHGRYSHGADYLEAILRRIGLATKPLKKAVLRKEGGKPVEGFVVSAQAPMRRAEAPG